MSGHAPLPGVRLDTPRSQRGRDQTLTLRPDRVAAYWFAFVPWMRAHMKYLPDEAMPSARLKLELLATTVDALVGAGYRQIGMDHFALPADELGQAIDRGELHRNVMGDTVQKTHDLVALGVSGIGEVQGAFVRNTKKLPEYYAAVGAGRFAIERGYEMSPDDLLTAAGSPAADGLVTVSGSAIEVTPLGRMFVRNICMVFDQYLRDRTAGAQPVFSRTV